jgi:hypothetical protein
MMSIAASFSLSKKPRFVDQERKKPILQKVMLADTSKTYLLSQILLLLFLL